MGRGGRSSGGGGGRGFSSGGGRSFSSRSASSSRGGRTNNTPNSSRGSSGNSGPRYVNRNIYAPIYSKRVTNYGGSGGVNRAPAHYTGVGTGLLIMAVVVILVVGVILFSFAGSGGGGGITKSTVKRTALPSGMVNETDYFTDELGWIGDKSKLEKGLKYFYKKTGIQPYVYITDTVNGSKTPTEEDARIFAEEIYDSKFTDEAHFLVIFHEFYSGQYTMWQLGGKQTKTVMDDEAVDILFDYLEKNYYSDLSEEEFFSNSFEEAGDRIMTVTKSPMPVIIILTLSAVIIALAMFWWKKIKDQKNLEAKRTEEILNTPLETFGDDEAAELAKKYENKN